MSVQNRDLGQAMNQPFFVQDKPPPEQHQTQQTHGSEAPHSTNAQAVSNLFNSHAPQIEISDNPPPLSNHQVVPKSIEDLLTSVKKEHDTKDLELTENKKALTEIKTAKIAAVILGITAAALVVGGIVACIVFPPAGLGALAAVVVIGSIVSALGGGALVWQMMKKIDDAVNTDTLTPTQIQTAKTRRDQLKEALELLDSRETPNKFQEFLKDESIPRRKNDQGHDIYELKDLDTYVALYKMKKEMGNFPTPEQIQNYNNKLADLRDAVDRPLPPPAPPPPPPPTPSEVDEFQSRQNRLSQLDAEIKKDQAKCDALNIKFNKDSVDNEIAKLEKENKDLMIKVKDSEPPKCQDPKKYQDNLDLIQFLQGILPKLQQYEDLERAQNEAFNRMNPPTQIAKLEQQISALNLKLAEVEAKLKPAELFKAQIAEKQRELETLEAKKPSKDQIDTLEKNNKDIQEKLNGKEPVGETESAILRKQENDNLDTIKGLQEHSNKVNTAKTELERLKEQAANPNAIPQPSSEQKQLEAEQKQLLDTISGLKQQVATLKAAHPHPAPASPASPAPANPANPVPNTPVTTYATFDAWNARDIGKQELVSFRPMHVNPTESSKYYHPTVGIDKTPGDSGPIYIFGSLNDKQESGPEVITLKGQHDEGTAKVNFGGEKDTVRKASTDPKLGYQTENNYLSLLYKQEIKVDGVTYTSPIHYLLIKRIEKDTHLTAQGKDELKNIVLRTDDPKKIYDIAKENWASTDRITGRRLAGEYDSDLCLFKGMDNELKKILYHKFVRSDGQPNELGRKLIATGDRRLYAGNEPGGAEFGMQFASSETMIGENKLGHQLMALRTYLKSIPQSTT